MVNFSIKKIAEYWPLKTGGCSIEVTANTALGVQWKCIFSLLPTQDQGEMFCIPWNVDIVLHSLIRKILSNI